MDNFLIFSSCQGWAELENAYALLEKQNLSLQNQAHGPDTVYLEDGPWFSMEPTLW